MSTNRSIRQALLTTLYQVLTEDEELTRIAGGNVRLHYMQARKNQRFPYLVHGLAVRYLGDKVIADGIYELDIYDHGDDTVRLLAMHHRIISLLDNGILPVPGEDALGVRTMIESDEDVLEQAEGVWHIATCWRIRYARQKEILDILEREET
jgi:hypothetical protein